MPATSAPPAAREIVFTDEQRQVINDPASSRQLVEAGPGTGKTAVACARIVKLVNDGLNPSAIMMISFTRAAVREMRDRIRGWPEAEKASAVRILTIDQTAFRFAKGAGADPMSLLQGFEVTMAEAVKQLKAGQGDLVKYAASLRHVLVDEAQDITDIRADFVEAVIGAISKDCGVTILADDCQSIYGFTRDQGEGNGGAPRFFLTACRESTGKYTPRALTQLHRTQATRLAGFFGTVRKAVTTGNGETSLEAILTQIESGGDGLGEKVETYGLQHGDLLLFRKRAQALHAANFFSAPHRLRLPGYPAAIFAWVGLCLSDFTGTALSAAEFKERWDSCVSGAFADGWSPGDAFEALRNASGSGPQLDLRRLRAVLGQSRPPIELCYPDYGSIGPIFSTIHASKGREADRVVLMLPRNWKKALKKPSGTDAALHEEARVLYVGATRVRKSFSHGLAMTLADSKKLGEDNDREVGVPFDEFKRAKFQFGRSGDIAPGKLVSAREPWCGDDDKAVSRQKALVALWTECLSTGTLVKVVGRRIPVQVGKEWHYAYGFSADTQKAEILGFSSDALIYDLFRLAKMAEARAGGKHGPPTVIPYLQLVGLRTVVISDDALAAELCEPYSGSRVFLAPMITGFANFKTRVSA